MKKIIQPEKIGVITLFIFLFFFDFVAKFIGYNFVSNASPFRDFIDVAIVVAIGDILFLGVLLNIFGNDVANYFNKPELTPSFEYGLSLMALILAIMVPVGVVTININVEFFYDYWSYKDIPVFFYSENLFSPGFKFENILYFICIAIVTPLIEELVYRLILYRIFRRKFAPVTSVFLVAGVFSLMHPVYFFFFFIFSLALSFLIHKTGSVWSAIIAHGTFNSLVYVDTYYLGIGEYKPIELIKTIDAWDVQFIFFPITLLIISMFARNNKNELKKLFSRSAVKNELP